MDDLGFGKVIKHFLLFIFGISLIGGLLTEFVLKPIQESKWKPYVPSSPFTNIDPNRPVTDIAEYDYENKTVRYYDYSHNEESDKQMNDFIKRNSETIVLKTPDGEIDTGLSSEEILEQLELDYHDVGDYLGDERQ